MDASIFIKMKQIILVSMNLFFCMELYYSEWWEVNLYGERCLYPDSFHIFVNEICVGSLHSEHPALCLPLNGETEELFHLPPTHDKTIFSFNVLDIILRFLFIIPFIIIVLQYQNHQTQSHGLNRGGGSQYSNNIILGAVHFGSALLLGLSIFVVILAPTADSQLWAEGVATCEVELNPGAGPIVAFSGLICELVITLWYIL